MPPVVIAGAIAAAGAIGGAAISSNAAGNAASTQAQAANTAAQLQSQTAQNSLDFAKQQWGTTQANAAPWLQAGQAGVNTLANRLGLTTTSTGPTAVPGSGVNRGGLTPAAMPGGTQGGFQTTPHPGAIVSATDGVTQVPNGGRGRGGPANINLTGSTQPGIQQVVTNAPATAQSGGSSLDSGQGFGSLMTPWTQQFTAPTAAEAAATPGEQFIRNQGLSAITNSAAARGNMLSGSTLKGLENYAGGLASTYYGDAYNRALGEYQQNYNIYNQNQANQFNRLASISGIGQTTANQLASTGANTASNIANINSNMAGQVGQNINNAGAATASGYIGSANAINSGIGGATSAIGNTLLLSQLLGGNSAAASNPYGTPQPGAPTIWDTGG